MITDPNILNAQSQSMAIFNVALDELAENIANIKVLSSDMSARVGLDRFKAYHPQDFINVGIAEQNLIGVAAGLSSEDYRCVAVAQASFISMRCFEQVRQYLSYMQYPVILVGYNSGFMLQQMGNTHFAIEDIAIMKSLPNMTVLSPADAFEAYKIFIASFEHQEPTYIRLTGNTEGNQVYSKDYPLEIGKNVKLRDGHDIYILATGSMVSKSLEAADILQEHGISVAVENVHTIKPFDKESIISQANKKLLVSIEEHNIIGGIGSSVADVMAEKGIGVPLLKLGIRDTYSKVGSYDYLLKQHRLTPELIAEDILKKLKEL